MSARSPARPSPRRASRAEPFERSRDYVESLARGLKVLRSVAQLGRDATLARVAADAGLSRAAARRLILTLEYLGYVQPAGRGYALTPRVLEFGHGFLGAESLSDLARPCMQRLSQRIHESCSMAVLDDRDVVYIARVAVRKIMTASLSVGARLPAFCTSMGRVLLAALDPPALDHWLEQCAPVPLTQRTVTDRQRLRAIIERVRGDGYAWVEQELEMGLCSLAVPLRDHTGRVVAALNTAMPFQSAAHERALVDLLPALQATAREIERTLPAGWLTPVRA